MTTYEYAKQRVTRISKLDECEHALCAITMKPHCACEHCDADIECSPVDRYYTRDAQGLVEQHAGEWHVEDGKAYRVDPEQGVDWSSPRALVGPVEQWKGWPDASVIEYEGGVLLPTKRTW